MEKNIFLSIYELYKHLFFIRKIQYFFLILLMLLASFAEVLSIGAVIPFLTVFSNPETISDNIYFDYFLSFLNLDESIDILFIFTFIFVTAILLSAILRILLMRYTIKLSFITGADIGAKIFEKTLYMAYQDHISVNSSETINGISKKTDLIIDNVILQVTNLTSSFFLLSIILSALIYIDTNLALTALTGFGTIYLLIIFFTKNKLIKNSNNVAFYTTNVVKILQESLGGIKNLIIGGTQEIFYKNFRSSDLSLRRAQGNTSITVQSPKFIMEGLGMSLIALLAFFLNEESNNLIPVLGALALGAQRLLPVLQQAYAAWSSMRGAQASLIDIVLLLNKDNSSQVDEKLEKKIDFSKKIKFEDISFKYDSDSKYVLNDINFSIYKGSMVGFVGETGSGKSTLLDLLTGLLIPSLGKIVIDKDELNNFNKRNWQKKISFVPQDIFLIDSTLRENIAFGASKKNIDDEKIIKVSKIAQIHSFIDSLPEKYSTQVGERGARLSGGELQRVGIARALYNNSEILVLDEATSALDENTERKLMQGIYDLGNNLTVLIIAHRISTLKRCNSIIKLNQGKIEEFSTIDEYNLHLKL